MSLIKFCGLFRDEDILFANKLKPDYIGFVFAESSRKVTIEKSLYLKSMLQGNIKTVGVFLNNNVEDIIGICSKKIIDMVQLHGDIDNQFIDLIKLQINIPVIKAVGVKNIADITALNNSHADYFLFDNVKAGSGKQFDYDILKKANIYNFNKKYFLAGGINISNIEKAMEFEPYCIDISSGIEKNGIKDYYLMEEIINKIKGSR